MNTPEDMTELTPLLPAAAAKRKRANIKPGTCIRLQPLKPGASKLFIANVSVSDFGVSRIYSLSNRW